MRRRVALLGIAALLLGCGTSIGTTSASGSWAPMAQSPLSARYGSVGAWTGSELVVVGGSTSQPCPVGAVCDMAVPDGLRDGAAYDPARDRWRRIADSPLPVFDAPTAWSGSEVVVLTPRATLTYDPAEDVWDTWSRRPYSEVSQIVPTDRGLLVVGYSTRGRDPVDWVFADHEWTSLPRDPFGESYDRSIAWDGERHWLLSMAVENHFEATRGASSRVAVLEDGVWSVVSESTTKLGYEQRWWFTGRRMVVPPRKPGEAAYYEPDAARWTSLETSEDHDCNLPVLGVGPEWVGGGGSVLVGAASPQVLDVPACPQLARPDTAVWAGRELLVWGGVSPDSRNQSVGLRWTPPAP